MSAAPKTPRRKVVVEKSKTHIVGFKSFIREQGVAGLAIGLVLGGAVSVLVKSLIDNILMPPLGFILGSAEGLKGLTLHLGTTPAGKPAVLHYGTFLNDIVNFLVIALVIYAIVHLLGFDRKEEK
ncbi:MAG TPA: MscL family protein [Verrucomicrobiae bacterium]|nr:MscL family protein [Verrucomicrobiae bacterium]